MGYTIWPQTDKDGPILDSNPQDKWWTIQVPPSGGRARWLATYDQTLVPGDQVAVSVKAQTTGGPWSVTAVWWADKPGYSLLFTQPLDQAGPTDDPQLVSAVLTVPEGVKPNGGLRLDLRAWGGPGQYTFSDLSMEPPSIEPEPDPEPDPEPPQAQPVLTGFVRGRTLVATMATTPEAEALPDWPCLAVVGHVWGDNIYLTVVRDGSE